MSERIYLSPPHMGGREKDFVQEAFDTNWIAPLGPNVDAFELEFAEYVGADHALALSSGTAAMHLALLVMGIGPGDRVFVSDLTFVASVNPIRYVGAEPTLIDCERESWNMDPALLEEALEAAAKNNTLPKAVVVVHLYGQSANLEAITKICDRFEVPIIEDAAEALGAKQVSRPDPGTVGRMGFFSFNGNKIITTSGGGMLVSADKNLLDHARKLATQAREPVPHYEHEEIGFNYRLSNILAGVGRGQLEVIEDRVRTRRSIFERYEKELKIEGIEFQPEAIWGKHTRWLTCLTVDENILGTTRDAIRLACETANIEARPVWKPMHLQPLYREVEKIGGSVSKELFETGLCLPSGSSLSESEQSRVIDTVKRAITL